MPSVQAAAKAYSPKMAGTCWYGVTPDAGSVVRQYRREHMFGTTAIRAYG